MKMKNSVEKSPTEKNPFRLWDMVRRKRLKQGEFEVKKFKKEKDDDSEKE